MHILGQDVALTALSDLLGLQRSTCWGLQITRTGSGSLTDTPGVRLRPLARTDSSTQNQNDILPVAGGGYSIHVECFGWSCRVLEMLSVESLPSLE